MLLLTALVAAVLATSESGLAETGVRLPALPTAAGHSPATDTVTVAPGDHFWKISARRLAEIELEAPVGPYWRKVVEVNLDNIRSGDPDLIYPGEVVELPAP